MTDPVTNVEVEDVLSSIRKLVSQDASVASADETTAETPPDCLILEPSQRVDLMEDDAPEAAQEESRDDAAEQPVMLSEAHRTDRDPDISNIPGDARLSEFGEVQGDVSEEFEPVEFPEPTHEPRRVLSELIEREVAAAFGSDRSEDDPVPEDSAPFWHAPEGYEGDEAEFPSDSDDDYDPAPEAWSEEVTEKVPEEAPEVAQADVDEPSSEDEDASEPQTLEEKISALERLVSENDHAPEDDRLEDDEVIAENEPMYWPEQMSDGDEDSVLPPLGSNVLHSRVWPDKPDSGDTELVPEPEPVAPPATVTELDEEQLRTMIADTIRQELQGALGERITRNVRKLVRREIHRMLMSQDFD